MTLKIERTRNTNDESNSGSVLVNPTNSITIIPQNINRLGIFLSNNSNRDFILKFQDFSIDNLKIGILLLRGDVFSLLNDNMYTGEVSAISISGSGVLDWVEF